MAAQDTESPPITPDSGTKSQWEVNFRKDYEEDWDVHRKWVQTLDPIEAMLIGQVYDQVSNSMDGSKITDSYTATLAIERAARVMGKLPTGNTTATKADAGKAAFMDILRQKWIYPNAKSQLPFESKMELIQLYSDVYGYMPEFIDWNVAPSGYIGPDCWIWNPRNLVFQQGRAFFNDMEYVTALTWVSKSFIQDILDDHNGSPSDEEDNAEAGEEPDAPDTEPDGDEDDGWNLDALQELVLQADKATGPDVQRDTEVSRWRTPQATKKGICFATRYEAGDDGEWITFAPDNGYMEVRRLKNPHKNGLIPFRLKYSQELFDSVYGLGDFARSKPLQFARDGLTNFYFHGIKMNIVPPLVVNANGVLKHTINYEAGAVMMETIPNSVRRLETSTAGLATYQGVQTALTGSLLSLWGSQNAAQSGQESMNPTQGKTPAAISLYSDKEADRDGRARKRLENFIVETTNAFYGLIATIGTETIPVNLFAKDLQEIEDAGLSDVGDIFKNFKPNSTFTGGELQIDPTTMRDIEFTFNIEWGSTAVINKQQQLQELEGIMADLAKFQNNFENDPSIEVNWPEILKVREQLTNIPGVSKFVTQRTPQEVAQIQAQQQQAQKMSNPIQAPNGRIYEQADLGKMYIASTTPDDVKNEILQIMGLQPSRMPSPVATQQAVQHSTIIKNAAQTKQAQAAHHLNTGKHLLDVAKEVDAQTAPQPEQPPQEPTVAEGSGGAYRDPTLAAAANQVNKM